MLYASLVVMPLGLFLLQPCLEMTWNINKATGNTRLLVTRPKHLQRQPVQPKPETGLGQEDGKSWGYSYHQQTKWS